MRATLVSAVCGAVFAFQSGLVERASAELVVNGGFETGSFTLGWATGDFGPTGLSVVMPGHLSTYSADISNPSSTVYDVIYQTLPTMMGQSYSLTFWVFNSGAGDDSLQVDWEGVNVLDLTPVSTMLETWEQVTVSPLTATMAGSELRFRGFDSISNFLIDDISVNAVPEASAMVAVGLVGVLAAAAVQLRRTFSRS